MNDVYNVEWKSGLLKEGWKISSKPPLESEEFLFWRLSLKGAIRNLRASNVKENFDKLIEQNNLGSWWVENCGGNDPIDKMFMLQGFPQDQWSVPWELLVQRLRTYKRKATINIIRRSGKTIVQSPSQFDEPLRILILLGDDGEALGPPLDLDLEGRTIIQAYNDLEDGFKQCVSRPEVHRVSIDDLTNKIKEHKPHLLWFSGHGNSKPNEALYFNKKTWISASTYAKAISDSGHIPLYAIFWACKTGSWQTDKKHIPYPEMPSLCQELTNIGVASILAMQARISDVGARIMATDVFRFLSTGHSMELAVARTRANMIGASTANTHPLDWACPVIWSSGRIVTKLSWNQPAQPFAQLALTGRQVIRTVLPIEGRIDNSPTQDDLFLAKGLEPLQRVWVQSNQKTENADIRSRWVKLLQAIQVKSQLGMLALDLDVNRTKLDLDAALQNWAAQIVACLFKDDLEDDVAGVIDELRQGQPISGWKNLCYLRRGKPKKLLLAISSPPAYVPTHWFWAPLLDAVFTGDLFVIILSDQQPDNHYLLEQDWKVEAITPVDERNLSTIIAEQPRLVNALAVLNIPVRTDFIEGAGFSLTQLPNREKVLVETGGGPVLRASIRDYVMKQMSQADMQSAHEDCVRILDNPQIDLSDVIREMRAEHYAKAGRLQESILEIEALFINYQQEDRPNAIISLQLRTGIRALSLPSSLLLHLAWAHMRLGQAELADVYLQQAVVRDPLDKAWMYQIQSEIAKSMGNRELALQQIDQAVEVCENLVASLKKSRANDAHRSVIHQMTWGYRQDRARIKQYLFFDKEKAILEYEFLLDNQPTFEYPGREIDIAIVQRNYAECLRTLAVGPDDQLFTKAREVLTQAETNLKHLDQVPIYSEVIYEKAKTAEGQQDDLSFNRFLDDSVAAAVRSRHFMMAAIAKCKIFRNSSTNLDLRRWAEIEEELARFSYHGWAVRSHWNGRIYVARQLEMTGKLPNAIEQLKNNLNEFGSYPKFDKGSDQQRIAKTYAGLQVLSDQLGPATVSYWSDFLSTYSWSEEWLLSQGVHTPEEVWREVK